MAPKRPPKATSVAKRGVRSASPEAGELGDLLAQLRSVIRESRQQALRAVDVVHVRTCSTVGRHIVEFEQGGASRAAFGARLLTALAERLTAARGSMHPISATCGSSIRPSQFVTHCVAN